jgi:hypothetical protein
MQRQGPGSTQLSFTDNACAMQTSHARPIANIKCRVAYPSEIGLNDPVLNHSPSSDLATQRAAFFLNVAYSSRNSFCNRSGSEHKSVSVNVKRYATFPHKELCVLRFSFDPRETWRAEESTAASKLAGDSSVGSLSMLITETTMVSTVWIGFQRIAAVSCGFVESSPGSCRIEMHTSPFGYTAQTKYQPGRAGRGFAGVRDTDTRAPKTSV